jgi:2-methylfumaryl-CoA isomerase
MDDHRLADHDLQTGAERLPLRGLRVIEVSSFVAAPLGGMTLAQLGADVIRVDPIGGAADTERWPVAASGTSLYWAGLNKGKRSIEVDMRSEAGRRIVTDLISAEGASGGVVITNAVAQPWLGHEALARLRPDLIHVHVVGRSDGTPAVDYTVNAATGFPMVTGPQGHADPVNHVLPAWDIACGLYAAVGILAAERTRQRTGLGQSVRIALEDVALATAGNLGFLAEAQVNHAPRARIGNYLYGGFARDFSCLDGGRVMVVALTKRHWADLVDVTQTRAVIESLETTLGADFGTERDRFTYREVLAGVFQLWFEARAVPAVRQALEGTSILWSQYRTFADVVDDHAAGRLTTNLLSTIVQHGVGPHLAPASPLSFDGTHPPLRAAPRLGEHTTAVLREQLSLSAEQIEDLTARGVVGAPRHDSGPPSTPTPAMTNDQARGVRP